MIRPVVLFLNVLYLLYLLLSTIAFLTTLPFILLCNLLNKGRFDDAIRFSNHLYSTFLVRISWPLIRLHCAGNENIPKSTSSIIVVNHRSTADIFFGSFFTTRNTTVFVRSWPFRLWGVGWFMRNAGYIDVEKMDMYSFSEGTGRGLVKRGVSFLFYPEGHRSLTGKLQPFRSGAFMIATELDIPIVPVCVTGTETLLSMKDPLIRRAKINIKILPPVYPSSFPAQRRAANIKRYVEALIKENLNE